jgi:hypothetical protein
MGLLDDAIREHLELKRLKGADPGAVAREEKDALGPVPRTGHPEDGPPEGGEVGPSPDADGSFFPGAESAPPAGPAGVGQETAEINMEAELQMQADLGHDTEAAGDDRTPPPGHPAHGPSATEESLEWEVPANRPDHLEHRPGLEGEGDSRAHGHPEGGHHVEDVLEETPDFLRDTPEQERLWFEQRPPRDFDFNE